MLEARGSFVRKRLNTSKTKTDLKKDTIKINPKYLTDPKKRNYGRYFTRKR